MNRSPNGQCRIDEVTKNIDCSIAYVPWSATFDQSCNSKFTSIVDITSSSISSCCAKHMVASISIIVIVLTSAEVSTLGGRSSISNMSTAMVSCK